MNSYVVLIERAEDGGFGAWAPDLPGCIALGNTYEEAVAEMREAMSFHLAGLKEDGLLVPAPSTIGSTTLDAA